MVRDLPTVKTVVVAATEVVVLRPAQWTEATKVVAETNNGAVKI